MSRKGENIYKRKDGRWEGRYIKSRTSEGKTNYGYVYAGTYREVKIKLADKKSSGTGEADRIGKCDDCFGDAAWEWFGSVVPRVKVSTENKYRNMLNSYIIPRFGDRRLDEMTQAFIEKQCTYYLAEGGLRHQGLSSKTVSEILTIVRSVLNYAAGKGKTVHRGVDSVHIKVRSKEIRILSRREQEKLCRHISANPSLINMGILICLFTGLRLGEVCALRWEDVHFSDNTVTVRHTLQRIQVSGDEGRKTKLVITAPKSPCSQRTIPLPNELAYIMKSFKTTDSGYVLTNSEINIMEPRTMQNHFKRIMKQLSVDSVTFHCLRHTFATRCIELGFDVKSLSEILGHSGVNITMNRYVHPSMELKKENMQRLTELFTVR